MTIRCRVDALRCTSKVPLAAVKGYFSIDFNLK